MKQTWKWAMMLFMAITLAVGTTSCSSDDDDEGGNLPAKLQGKWMCVYEKYVDENGSVTETTYDETDAIDFFLITSHSFTEMSWGGEDPYTTECSYKDGYLIIDMEDEDGIEGDVYRIKLENLSDSYFTIKAEVEEGGYMISDYKKIPKFPWE